MLRSILVSDYMATNLVVLSPNMTVLEAVSLLLKNRISGAPVLEEGKLVGVFSESDCLKGALQSTYHGTDIGTVSEYMSTDIHSVSPDSSVLDVAELFLKNQRRRLPVVNEGKLVGQISRRDVLRAIEDFARKHTL